MEIEIESKRNNPLLNRTEVYFIVKHPGEGTPNREIIRSELADKLKELKAQAEIMPVATLSLVSNLSAMTSVLTKTTDVAITPSLNTSTVVLTPLITLFLAEVTENLEEYRQEVKRYLEQHLKQQGVRILPDKTYAFATLQQSLDQDLSECSLFVQLLSDKTDQLNYAQFQYERAQIASLPILQWRDPTLNLATIL